MTMSTGARSHHALAMDQQDANLLNKLEEFQRRASRMKVPVRDIMFLKLLDSLEELRRVVIEAPRPPVSKDSYPVPVLINKVTVSTSGTPVQGPDQEVPPGYAVVVRQRRHTGTVNGYLAFSDADTGNDLRRSVLRDNDSISFRLRNLNWLWFDSDTNVTNFEVIVEVAR